MFAHTVLKNRAKHNVIIYFRKASVAPRRIFIDLTAIS